MIWWSMNVDSVLECWDERIAHIGRYIDLCIIYEYVWHLCVMWKVCSHICIQTHTHMNDDLDNKGSLKGEPKNTLNL